MHEHIERDVRFLKRYAICSALACGALALAAFTQQARRAKFDEIDVERINVVKPGGNGVPLVARRVFIGRDHSKAAIVNLSAPDGKPRLRLIVDSLGAARIEFLDADGRVTTSLPGK